MMRRNPEYLCAWMLIPLPLLALGCHMGEYLGTPEGKKTAGDAVDAVVAFIGNPMNPLSWIKLASVGATLGAGAFAGAKGAQHAPRAARAVGRGAKHATLATGRGIAHVGKAVHRRLTKPKDGAHVAP